MSFSTRVRAAVILTSGLLAPSLLVATDSPAAHPTLEVYVANASDNLDIPGARVQILSEAGAVITEAVTNGFGAATLPIPASSAHPALILVRSPAFYIGGISWSPGAREVCVHLVIWRTCDRMTVKAPSR